MNNLLIDISYNGAIKLGQHVTCDGFVYGYEYRIQTHVHDDHMNNFDSSKHFQTIIVSEATRSLLEVRHIEMPYSTNIISHPINGIREYDGLTIEFKPSSHMLGAVQVAVTTQAGDRLGYSGDFSWPLEDVIKVKGLVVDSTYGNPDSVRDYSQEDAHDFFRELVVQKIRSGPIIIKGHRGTLYRAFELLDGLVQCPIIASKKKIDEAKVCEKYGYCICPLMELELPDVRKLRKEGPYIELRYIGEQILYDPGDSTTVNLTASWVQGPKPFLKLSESSYQIAISDHADFNETLEYVRETGARYVLTDSIHGNHAPELAIAITKKLGIKAKPAKTVRSRAWGV
jgi:putative mRNA 3-end processing factor